MSESKQKETLTTSISEELKNLTLKELKLMYAFIIALEKHKSL